MFDQIARDAGSGAIRCPETIRQRAAWQLDANPWVAAKANLDVAPSFIPPAGWRQQGSRAYLSEAKAGMVVRYNMSTGMYAEGIRLPDWLNLAQVHTWTSAITPSVYQRRHMEKAMRGNMGDPVTSRNGNLPYKQCEAGRNVSLGVGADRSSNERRESITLQEQRVCALACFRSREGLASVPEG